MKKVIGIENDRTEKLSRLYCPHILSFMASYGQTTWTGHLTHERIQLLDLRTRPTEHATPDKSKIRFIRFQVHPSIDLDALFT